MTSSAILKNEYFFQARLWHVEIPNLGLNLCHSSNSSLCSDARSLTRCAIGALLHHSFLISVTSQQHDEADTVIAVYKGGS